MESWLQIDEPEESLESRVESLEQQQLYLVYQEETRKIMREKRKKKKELKPTTGFIQVHKKLFMKAVRDRMFTPGEERMLFKLIPFCNVESNVVTDEDGLPMSQKDIIALVGMNKGDVISIMEGLIQKNVLSKHTKGKHVYYKFTADWVGK
jgi:hypothetical protein